VSYREWEGELQRAGLPALARIIRLRVDELNRNYEIVRRRMIVRRVDNKLDLEVFRVALLMEANDK
jgi:hypothetical protein